MREAAWDIYKREAKRIALTVQTANVIMSPKGAYRVAKMMLDNEIEQGQR
jgi:hypothetical protein